MSLAQDPGVVHPYGEVFVDAVQEKHLLVREVCILSDAEQRQQPQACIVVGDQGVGSVVQIEGQEHLLVVIAGFQRVLRQQIAEPVCCGFVGGAEPVGAVDLEAVLHVAVKDLADVGVAEAVLIDESRQRLTVVCIRVHQEKISCVKGDGVFKQSEKFRPHPVQIIGIVDRVNDVAKKRYVVFFDSVHCSDLLFTGSSIRAGRSPIDV